MKKLITLFCFILVGCKSIPIANEYQFEIVFAGKYVEYAGQNQDVYYFKNKNDIVAVDKETLAVKSLNIKVEDKEYPFIYELEGKKILKSI